MRLITPEAVIPLPAFFLPEIAAVLSFAPFVAAVADCVNSFSQN